MSNAVELKNYSISYKFKKGKGEYKALDNLTIDFPKGEIIGLIGPSGGGQESLLLSLKENFDGIVSGNKTISGAYDCIGDLANYNDGIDEKDNIDKYLKKHYGKKSASDEQILNALKIFGVERYRHENLMQLNLYNRLLVRLALSVANGFNVIGILDFPASGYTRSMLMNLIKDIKEKLDITLLITTEYFPQAFATCDKVALFKLGKLIIYGTPEEVRNTKDEDNFIPNFLAGHWLDIKVEEK